MLIYWFLPMILFLGIVTSYEDIKYGKIRNKWVLAAILYSVFIYFFLFFFYDGYSLDYPYFGFLLLNGVLALMAGFLLWKLEFWKAGDAKLFFAFSLMAYPENFMWGKIIFDDMLINIFVPLAIFLIFGMFARIPNNEKIRRLKKIIDFWGIVLMLFYLFSAIWLISLASAFLGTDLRFVLVLFMIYFVYRIRKFSIALIVVLLFFAVARILLDKSLFFMESWTGLLYALLALIALRFIVSLAYSGIFAKRVPFEQLREGMHFAGPIYSNKSGMRDKPSPKNKGLFLKKPRELTGADIHRIGNLPEWVKSRKFVVVETISFAPFIFFGVLLQVMLGSNIILPLYNLLV